MANYKGGVTTVQSVKDITVGGGYARIGTSWNEMYDLGATQGAVINFARGTLPITDGSPSKIIDQHVVNVTCNVQLQLLEKRLEDMLKVLGFDTDIIQESAANPTKDETEYIRLISTSKAHLNGTNLVDGSVHVYKQSNAIAKIYGMNSGVTNRINAIDMYYDSGTDTMTAIAVGDNGLVLKFEYVMTGIDWSLVNWTSLTSSTTKNLLGVYLVDSDNFAIVGEEGYFAYSTDGSTITVQATGVTYDLNAVIGLDTNNYWVVGDQGHIDHFDASIPAYTADARTQITGHDLFGIAHSGNAAVIVGNGYVGYSSDITSNDFNARTPHSGETYYGVYMKDVNTIFVVGAYGAAYKSTNGGGIWSQLSLETNVHLYGVDGDSNNQVVIVGGHGEVITSTDLFSSFKKPEKITNYDLMSVAYGSATLWFMAGDQGELDRMTQLDSESGWEEAVIYNGSNAATAEVIVNLTYGTVQRFKDSLTSIPSPGKVKVVYQWNKPASLIGSYGGQNTLPEFKLMIVHTRKDGNREIYKFERAIPVPQASYALNPGGVHAYPAAFQIMADPSKDITEEFFTLEIEGQTKLD